MVNLVYLLALLAGAGIAVQLPMTAVIGQRIGLTQALFFVTLTGLVTLALVLVLGEGYRLAAWRSLPWSVYLAGPIGVGAMGAVAFAIPRIGVSSALGLSIAAQLLIGAILDRTGFFSLAPRPLEWPRLIGAIAITLGAWLVVR